MAVVCVEIPDDKAKDFKPNSVISLQDFREKTSDEDSYVSMVDFGPQGMTMEDYKEFKSRI